MATLPGEDGDGAFAFNNDFSGGRARVLAASAGRRCPYLSTVNRLALDFDMPKVCSVTLSSAHVYACLVCGKYFAGRGKQSPAYTHAIQSEHAVFACMEDGRFYCLPEGYEVLDRSLDDIAFALLPTFDEHAVRALDASAALSTDAHGRPYLPGLLGINDLHRTDAIAATVQALAHVGPLRDFMLDGARTRGSASLLVRRFGELIRRLWTPRALKCVVSPHDFVNAVSDASGRAFGVGKPAEAVEFTTWLLNTLHRDLVADAADASGSGAAAGSKRPRSDASPPRSIISDVFGGEVEVQLLSSELEDERARETVTKLRRAAAKVEVDEPATDADERSARAARLNAAIAAAQPILPQVSRTPALMLSLDLPPAPLFRGGLEGGVVIPQVPVYALLSKFDGDTVTEALKGQYRETRTYRLLRLPAFLLLAAKRFTRNAFFTERNPTVLTFPTRNLEMRPYAEAGGAEGATGALPSDAAVGAMSVPALRALIAAHAPRGAPPGPLPIEKEELVRAARAVVEAAGSATKYDLVASIVHDVPATADAVGDTKAGGGKGRALPPPVAPPNMGGAGEARAGAGENAAAAAVRAAAAVSDPVLLGRYKAHVSQGGGWYEASAERIVDALPQAVGVSDTVLMLYARRK
jgi:U4/U6.U5 tri-snRNP-associated protein 2